MRPRLLVVPHVFTSNVRVRGIELARRLASRFDVYILRVPSLAHVHARTRWMRRREQAARGFSVLARRPQLYRCDGGLIHLDYPYLDPVLLKGLGRGSSIGAARAFNGWVLGTVVRRFGISHVLLGSSAFGWKPSNPARLYLDIVDWFPEEKLNAAFVAREIRHLERQARHATAVFAVSSVLRDRLQVLFGREVIALPNGADVQRLRAVPRAEVDALRRRLGLNGRLVLSSIGNHADFSRLDFAVSVLDELRRVSDKTTLLVVGPCTDAVNRKAGPDVIYTGPVPPEKVDPYFHVTDVGLLTQEKSAGTDFAFQIKMVEYSICQKIVVSVPLEVWKQLRWPNVILPEPSASEWAKAIMVARNRSWDPSWDDIFEEYDWRVLADRMARVLLA